jgi:hypothetical protein
VVPSVIAMIPGLVELVLIIAFVLGTRGVSLQGVAMRAAQDTAA